MVYILHFHRKFKHAQHYVGYCQEGRLEERLSEHRAAKYNDSFMGKVNAAGIGWSLARAIPNANENVERRIKHIWKQTKRCCPVCTETPRAISPTESYAVDDLQMWERYWAEKIKN